MLFNTLANLRVLIDTDAARAQVMLDHLIAYLRATLNASRSEHPFAAGRIRAPARLSGTDGDAHGTQAVVRADAAARTGGAEVPTLLLQPLVENAIRHGLEPKVEGGHIAVRARRTGPDLVLEVDDTGVGMANGDIADRGFGLTQVRERLAHHVWLGGRIGAAVRSTTRPRCAHHAYRTALVVAPDSTCPARLHRRTWHHDEQAHRPHRPDSRRRAAAGGCAEKGAGRGMAGTAHRGDSRRRAICRHPGAGPGARRVVPRHPHARSQRAGGGGRHRRRLGHGADGRQAVSSTGVRHGLRPIRRAGLRGAGGRLSAQAVAGATPAPDGGPAAAGTGNPCDAGARPRRHCAGCQYDPRTGAGAVAPAAIDADGLRRPPECFPGQRRQRDPRRTAG